MSAEPSTRAAKPQGNSKCWEILESENMKNQQGQRPKTQALILCWKRWLGRMRKNMKKWEVHGYVGGLVTNNVHGWDWASGNELILHSSKFHGCNTRWPFLSSCDALPTWRYEMDKGETSIGVIREQPAACLNHVASWGICLFSRFF